MWLRGREGNHLPIAVWLEGAYRECPGAITGPLPPSLSAELTVSAQRDHASVSTGSSGGPTGSPAKAWAALHDPLMGAGQTQEPECAHTSYLSLACISPIRHQKGSCLFFMVTAMEPCWCPGSLGFR